MSSDVRPSGRTSTRQLGTFECRWTRESSDGDLDADFDPSKWRLCFLRSECLATVRGYTELMSRNDVTGTLRKSVLASSPPANQSNRCLRATRLVR